MVFGFAWRRGNWKEAVEGGEREKREKEREGEEGAGSRRSPLWSLRDCGVGIVVVESPVVMVRSGWFLHGEMRRRGSAVV
jgi:hypothetical protein